MDTKLARGLSSRSVNEEIVVVKGLDYEIYKGVIRAFLLIGEVAWADTYTLETIEDSIREGRMQVLLLRKRDNYRACLVTTIRDYGNKVLGVRFEILVAHNFFHAARAYKVVENLATEMGFSFIEAKTHPTIATYAVKKCGYKCPGVYIRKDLRKDRRN